MPFSQIEDELEFDGTKVLGKGTFERASGEVMKTLWVRVCQRNRAARGAASIAEGSANGDSAGVFDDTAKTWTLDLPRRQGELHEGDASVSAVLVFEADDDLFTLAWAECVHLKSAQKSA